MTRGWNTDTSYIATTKQHGSAEYTMGELYESLQQLFPELQN